MEENNSLTEGNIYKALIKFSIPFIIANLLQALYGTVDLLVIGLFTDTAGLSGVSTSTQVMQIVNGLILGLTMGGTILIGQYYGADKKKDVTETIGTMLSVGVLVSIVISILMYISTDPLLRALNTPPEAFADAKSYVLIASTGIIFIFGYNAIAAILRGIGDSKRPVYFIAVACVFNVVLDFLFVGYFGMRAGGAALATILSQAISMIIAMIFLSRKEFLFDFRLKNFSINDEKAKKLFRIGIPLSLQEVLLWGSFLVILAIANSMGVNESAAVGIVAKFETFSMLPPMALSFALAAIAAQNIGAGKPERAKKALHGSIILSFICSLFFLAWAQIHPQSIMGIFKADEAVVLAGAEYLKIYSIDFMFVAVKFNLNGFLNGCGRTTFTMLNGVASSILIRIPVAFLFGVILSKGLTGLGLSVPVSSVFSIGVSILYMKTGKWRERVV